MALYNVDIESKERKKERKKMSEREKIIQNISKMKSKLSDLYDMVDDGVPFDRMDLRREIENLKECISWEQDYLTSIEG